MLRKHTTFIKYAAACMDLLFLEVNWFVWYKITSSPAFGFSTGVTDGALNSWKTGTVLALTWLVLVGASRLYISKRYSTILSEWWDIAKYLFSVTIVFIFFASVFLDVHLLSRGGFAGFYATAFVTLCMQRAIVRLGLRTVRSRGFNYRSVLVVGAGTLGRRIAEKIGADPWLGYKIIGYLDDEVVEPVLGRYPVFGAVSDFASVTKQYHVDKVMIALPLRAYKKLETILELVSDTLMDCSVIPDFYHFQMIHAGIHDLDGIPIIDVVSTPIEGTDALLKRIADVILSIAILAVTFPLLVAIALGVKLSLPGPIFFVQERRGEGGKKFRLYKFRSMRVHLEGDRGPIQATQDDPRVTPFGRFLRRTSLDELPQFFNVLRGDMSVVGPRPHAVAHDEYYKNRIPPYLQRQRIKPGITGWAQINGWRGETADIRDMGKRIEYDLEYIQNWDIWFDIKIILMTLYRGFVSKRAY